MGRKYEEPIYIDLHKNSTEGDEARELEDDIRRLCEGQPFAVVATQGKGITKASLISFAASPELNHIVFATPALTGKFDNIASEENMPVLLDAPTTSVILVEVVRYLYVKKFQEMREWYPR